MNQEFSTLGILAVLIIAVVAILGILLIRKFKNRRAKRAIAANESVIKEEVAVSTPSDAILPYRKPRSSSYRDTRRQSNQFLTLHYIHDQHYDARQSFHPHSSMVSHSMEMPNKNLQLYRQNSFPLHGYPGHYAHQPPIYYVYDRASYTFPRNWHTSYYQPANDWQHSFLLDCERRSLSPEPQMG